MTNLQEYANYRKAMQLAFRCGVLHTELCLFTTAHKKYIKGFQNYWENYLNQDFKILRSLPQETKEKIIKEYKKELEECLKRSSLYDGLSQMNNSLEKMINRLI
jgi:hypothetical protein